MHKVKGKIIDGKRNGIWEIFFSLSERGIINFANGEANGLSEIYQIYEANIFEIVEIKFYLT